MSYRKLLFSFLVYPVYGVITYNIAKFAKEKMYDKKRILDIVTRKNKKEDYCDMIFHTTNVPEPDAHYDAWLDCMRGRYINYDDINYHFYVEAGGKKSIDEFITAYKLLYRKYGTPVIWVRQLFILISNDGKQDRIICHSLLENKSK